MASRCSDEEGEASPRTGSWKLWLGGGTNIPSFSYIYTVYIYIFWRRCLCPCSIKSLFLCFLLQQGIQQFMGLLMFMSYEKGGCCLGLCLQKPKDALKGTVSHWVLATWKVYIITASIELQDAYLQVMSPVFSLLCMYTFLLLVESCHTWSCSGSLRECQWKNHPCRYRAKFQLRCRLSKGHMPCMQSSTSSMHSYMLCSRYFIENYWTMNWQSRFVQMSCNCKQLFLPVWLWAPITPRVIWYYR